MWPTDLMLAQWKLVLMALRRLYLHWMPSEVSSSPADGNLSGSPITVLRRKHVFISDPLRGSSVKIRTIQRRVAWPLRKDATHKSRGVIITFAVQFLARPSVFELSDGRLVFWLMSIRADMPPHPVRKCRADMSRALVWRLYVRLRSGHVGRANAELGAD